MAKFFQDYGKVHVANLHCCESFRCCNLLAPMCGSQRTMHGPLYMEDMLLHMSCSLSSFSAYSVQAISARKHRSLVPQLHLTSVVLIFPSMASRTHLVAMIAQKQSRILRLIVEWLALVWNSGFCSLNIVATFKRHLKAQQKHETNNTITSIIKHTLQQQ